MTVHVLIDKLQQVEDKSKEALLYTAWVDSEGDYLETDYYEIESGDLEESSDSFVIKGCIVPF